MLQGQRIGIMHDSAVRLALLPKLGKTDLHILWRELFQKQPQQIQGRDLLIQIFDYQLQERDFRALTKEAMHRLSASARAVKANRDAEFLTSPNYPNRLPHHGDACKTRN